MWIFKKKSQNVIPFKNHTPLLNADSKSSSGGMNATRSGPLSLISQSSNIHHKQTNKAFLKGAFWRRFSFVSQWIIGFSFYNHGKNTWNTWCHLLLYLPAYHGDWIWGIALLNRKQWYYFLSIFFPIPPHLSIWWIGQGIWQHVLDQSHALMEWGHFASKSERVNQTVFHECSLYVWSTCIYQGQ